MVDLPLTMWRRHVAFDAFWLLLTVLALLMMIKSVVRGCNFDLVMPTPAFDWDRRIGALLRKRSVAYGNSMRSARRNERSLYYGHVVQWRVIEDGRKPQRSFNTKQATKGRGMQTSVPCRKTFKFELVMCIARFNFQHHCVLRASRRRVSQHHPPPKPSKPSSLYQKQK
ncbi:hypothetical protein GGR50DRAFT_653720 [Xylaria sp. CBS 124048]|nr:hypothetical protein GGR50DRAFT_653720 [Xylaria sp. CBS 124048]